MNSRNPFDWLIALCAGLILFAGALQFAIIIGLLIERIYVGRRLEAALQRLSLVQADLFTALGEAYRRVEHSNVMVMRVMRVVDRTLGIEVQEEEAAGDEVDGEWPNTVSDDKKEDLNHGGRD